ncbi:MAG: sensor domain-containing diguanylate cyclase [Acidobacteriia bacterium]|nr:sensor domain-containing diguanylate cyclase [Terriglobia bacterium]
MTALPPRICVLPATELEVFLERYRHDTGVPETMDPGRFIQEVLQRANAFVPSEAGSVLLDHPFERSGDPAGAVLYFIAAFGPAADSLLGASIATTEGVVGHVYRNGESHLGVEPRKDPFFYPRFDETHAFRTESLLAVPIRIENSVCGVLEMVNRLDGMPFDERDRALLEIFASYTSVSIQNLLDARRAGAAARSDDLTGLANDRFFHRRLAEDLDHADAAAGRVALLFMDLDNFKTVNDRHGHLAGSQVLKEVGYLLRRAVRSPRVTLARYGGDEFVIILPGFDIEAATHVAEEIRTAIRSQAFLRGRFSWASGPVEFTGPLTCSVGVAVYPDHVPRIGTSDHRRNQLLRASDQAMYAAKAAGKDRVVVTEGEPATPK